MNYSTILIVYISYSLDWTMTSIYIYHLITDWVVQLGPATFKGNYYQYSVVSGPEKLGLFVLARNVTEFKQNYDGEVLAKLKEQGFTRFYNKPTDSYQGKDCMYI